MIPAYSPQARGRSERNFGTWQGRLPQELRVHGIRSLAGANAFLREQYIAEFNQRFAVPAAQPGHAFLPVRRKNLDLVFSLQHERTVNQDNTVQIGPCILQIEKTLWRATLAGCRVTVHQHLEGSWSITYGPHIVGRYSREGIPLLLEPTNLRRPKAVEKTGAARPWKSLRDSHFSTATTTTKPIPTSNQNRTLHVL